MADKNKPDSPANRAGRWFARLLGRRNVRKLADSAEALKAEYRAGRADGAGPEEEPPRPIPHRVVPSEGAPAGEPDGKPDGKPDGPGS